MDFPLSKTLDPERDYLELAPELKHVDPAFGLASPQHEHRRFEYAMALRAFRVWGQRVGPTHGDPYCYDVGGAGSPFLFMLPCSVRVIDPTLQEDAGYKGTLEAYLQEHPRLGSCVFALSVLEHVDDLDRFLYHLGCLVAPGGLLFLTLDYTDDDPYPLALEDTKHFHWMRERIFNEHTLTQDVIEPLLDRDFSWLGEHDFTWHGAHVYDYGFASLALVKRA